MPIANPLSTVAKGRAKVKATTVLLEKDTLISVEGQIELIRDCEVRLINCRLLEVVES